MTLTQASILTKRVIVVFTGLVVLGIMGKVIFDVGYTIYEKSLPPVQIKPNIKFGQLPQIPYPKTIIDSSKLSYSLDTTTGTLPIMPKVGNVYFITPSSATLLSPDRANSIAKSLGFPVGPQPVSNISYNYTDNSGGSLNIDITDDNFSFQRPKSTNSNSSNLLPDSTQVVSDFQSYLSSKGLDHTNLDYKNADVVYDGPSQSQSETVTVYVPLAPIDTAPPLPTGTSEPTNTQYPKYPIVTANFKHGLISGVIAKNDGSGSEFIKVNYTYWPIDLTSFATYPLINVDTAYNNLKNGQSVIVYDNTSNNNPISITSVYLAYYEPDQYMFYLQPVYVFEGPKFAAYVTAIDPTLYQK